MRNDFLFIAPTLPCPHYSGLSQRSFHLARALSKHGRVHICYLDRRLIRFPAGRTEHLTFAASTTVMPPSPLFDAAYVLKWLLYRCSPYWGAKQPIPEHRFFSPFALKRLQKQFAQVDFKAVFVHRLYMIPYLEIAPQKPVVLDLDDWESVTRDRLAGLAGLLDRESLREELQRESIKYQLFEHKVLSSTNQILVCSETDAWALNRRYEDLNLKVLPNIFKPGEPLPRRGNNQELLFVGSFGYLPNWDAAVQASREILPHLPNCRLTLIGREASKLPSDVLQNPLVEVHQNVSDLRPHYQRAALAVVPLRAGGGTRIKILEAMAHGCPVVSSPIGSEGLGMKHGDELLIGQTNAEMAAHCREILNHPQRAMAMADRARKVIQKRFGLSCWEPVFEEVLRELPS